MIYRWIKTWHLEEYANWPFVGSTHDVYKSKDILCRSEGNLPRFFSKTSPGIFIVAWWLWRPRVSTRNVPCWTKPWRIRGLDRGFSFWPWRMCWLIWWDFSSVVILLNGPLEKNWESYFGALCKVSNICDVGKRHKWSAIWKEMQPENCLLLWRALCTRSSSTTGGWTHQRPLRRA